MNERKAQRITNMILIVIALIFIVIAVISAPNAMDKMIQDYGTRYIEVK